MFMRQVIKHQIRLNMKTVKQSDLLYFALRQYTIHHKLVTNSCLQLWIFFLPHHKPYTLLYRQGWCILVALYCPKLYNFILSCDYELVEVSSSSLQLSKVQIYLKLSFIFTNEIWNDDVNRSQSLISTGAWATFSLLIEFHFAY